MADQPGVAVMETGALEFRAAEVDDVDERRESRETVGTPFSDTPRMTCRNVNVYYGDNHAIKNVSLDIGREEVLAMVGPSGCGKSTFLRALNRMNDTIDGCRMTGEITLDGNDIHAKDMDVVPLRALVGMVFQKPNPFPKSIFDNVAYGVRIHGLGGVQVRARRDRRAQPQARRLVGGGERPARSARHRPVRRPAAAPVHRPDHRGESGGHPHGRALLGPRSHRHRPGRGPDPRAGKRLHHRHRHPLHAAGRPGVAAHRLSPPGRPAGSRPTDQIFTNPIHPLTEDYITGRFG